MKRSSLTRMLIGRSVALLCGCCGVGALSCDGADDEGEPVSAIASALTADGRNVWTNHNDNSRSGATLAETTLTTSNVNPTSFGKLFERAVDDQIFAQPLWLANVTIGGVARNVVYVATVNGTIYAFDADDPSKSTALASRSLLPAGAAPVMNTDVGQACGVYVDFSGKISIVGTPVIDVAAGTIYLVARYKLSGSFVQRLHALDITTLAERTNSPVVISASVPGTGEGSVGGNLAFNPTTQAQRAGLALSNGIVYISWASHCDTRPYHGWIMGYNASTLARTWVWNTTPNGTMAGVWQSGQPPNIDGSGRLYVMLGNGDSTARTGGNAYGNSLVKLDRTLTNPVVDWFTPFNTDQLNDLDWDLGSAGALLVPDGSNRIIGGGKEGKLYVLDTGNLGHFRAGADSQIVQSFQVADLGSNIHGGPVYYNSPGAGKLVYVWPENNFLKAFSYNGNTLNPTPQRQSAMRVPDGMPGGMLAVSANGSVSGSGILWAAHPYVGNANGGVQPGILRAFDASNISNELWNSRINSPQDDYGLFAKYAPPTVANGKVYLATFSGKLVVYGRRSQGLRADYFDNSDLTGQKRTRIDATVNNDWGTASPDPGLGADTFSVRWSGQVQPQFSETYTFYTTSDDGVRLWVNGVQLINNWTNHGVTENSGTIALTANSKVNIVMEYYDNTGSATAKLSWSSPSRPKEIIPSSRLFPRAATWEYSTDTEGWTLTRMTSSASGGKLTLTLTGADPQMRSPDNLNASAAFFPAVRVRLANRTADSTAQLYWTTTASPAFDETKKVNFAITPNDDRVREYLVFLSGNTSWTGTIKQIRLDPALSVAAGSLDLDAIRLSSSTSFADGRQYRLVARHSGKVADVTNGDPGDSVNIQQYTWNGTLSQLWEFVDLGGGYYYIVPKVSRKCMDVRNGDPSDGVQVQQYQCNATFSQHFKWISLGGGFYRIENRLANKVLDVVNGGIDDGALIQEWSWLGTTNQQFQIEAIE
jgi:PA14 domain/Ricin-type beta-trefoil lectin domain-like/PQQ-like domain